MAIGQSGLFAIRNDLPAARVAAAACAEAVSVLPEIRGNQAHPPCGNQAGVRSNNFWVVVWQASTSAAKRWKERDTKSRCALNVSAGSAPTCILAINCLVSRTASWRR